MANFSIRSKVQSIVVLFLTGIAWSMGSYAEEGSPEDFVFMGDSLSDPGNRFFYEGTLNTPPYNTVLEQGMIPSAPYAIGGPTFSNGKVFPEYIARALGRAGLAKPAARSSGIAANYGYAGARAANLKAPNSNRNLDQQVADYIADGVKQDAIHVVEIGGNDIGVALQALATGFPPVDPIGVIEDAIAGMFTQMLTLQAFGAERYLIVTAANSGLIPVFGANQLAIEAGYLLTSIYNCALVGESPGRPCADLGIPVPVPTLKQALEAGGAEVLVFEGQAFFDGLYFTPEAFGLTNVTDTCLMPNVPPYRCSNPDEYLFWDGTHPTKKVHQLIGEAIVAFLSE
jgi:outer membrane lipase/esterase